MIHSNLRRFALVAFIGFIFVWWLVGESEDGAMQQNTLHAAMANVGVPTSPSTAWSDASPFSHLSCKLANGGKVDSTACNPDAAVLGDASILEDARPDVRAQSALARIEAREFDKLHVLASSFNDCWFVHAPSLDQRKTHDQQVASGCDFALVERLVDKAQSAIQAASSQGDYVAREAYVELLMTKIMVNQNQLEFYDTASKDPDAISGVEKLQTRIDSARGQIVAFVQSLKDPSAYLMDVMATSAQLRESRVASGNAPQKGP